MRVAIPAVSAELLMQASNLVSLGNAGLDRDALRRDLALATPVDARDAASCRLRALLRLVTASPPSYWVRKRAGAETFQMHESLFRAAARAPLYRPGGEADNFAFDWPELAALALAEVEAAGCG